MIPIPHFRKIIISIGIMLWNHQILNVLLKLLHFKLKLMNLCFQNNIFLVNLIRLSFES